MWFGASILGLILKFTKNIFSDGHNELFLYLNAFLGHDKKHVCNIRIIFINYNLEFWGKKEKEKTSQNLYTKIVEFKAIASFINFQANLPGRNQIHVCGI